MNGNGATKIILSVLVTACFGLLGYAVAQNNEKIDTVKADLRSDTLKVEGRVDFIQAKVLDHDTSLATLSADMNNVIKMLERIERKLDRNP